MSRSLIQYATDANYVQKCEELLKYLFEVFDSIETDTDFDNCKRLFGTLYLENCVLSNQTLPLEPPYRPFHTLDLRTCTIKTLSLNDREDFSDALKYVKIKDCRLEKLEVPTNRLISLKVFDSEFNYANFYAKVDDIAVNQNALSVLYTDFKRLFVYKDSEDKSDFKSFKRKSLFRLKLEIVQAGFKKAATL